MPDDATVTIPADLAFTDAPAQQAVLLDACASGDLWLDLTPGQASASALQLLVAASKTLSAQGRFRGFGPAAAPYFVPHLNAN